jgi:hypothetical protein
MSCFHIPISTCDALRKALVDYWWGIEEGRKKMHWQSWEWLSTPKSLGGMGFRDLNLFNQAMLGRQCWRLLTDPSSLCARVLKGRYFPDCEVWEAPQPRSASYTWRSICYGMELVKQGIRWNVGDGSKIKLMTDNWIPGVPPGSLRTLTPIPNGATVDFLLSEDRGSWDVAIVRSVFEEEVANNVLQVPISRRVGSDFMSWPYTKFGDYTVRSAYNLARSEKFFLDRSRQGGGANSAAATDAQFWKKTLGDQGSGKNEN